MTNLAKITITVDSPIGIKTGTWYGKQVKVGLGWVKYWRSLGYEVTIR